MKTIIIYLSVILSTSYLYSQSSIVYEVGTTIDIGSGAEVCATNIILNGTFTGSGTFCNAPVDVAQENYPAIPKEFNLSQNFPNPFNPSTEIHYELPTSVKVILKIYDVLGNEIETLINSEEPAGYYNYNFNGTNLPSGVYFYRLKAGDYVQTKKMILLK